MQGSNHFYFWDTRNQGLFDCRSRCDTKWMAIQTSFAEKVIRFQNSDYCFLAPLGNDSELDLGLLDVKNGIRRIALAEVDLILPIIVYALSVVYFREKHLGIKRELCFAVHWRPSLSRGYPLGHCECVATGTVRPDSRSV